MTAPIITTGTSETVARTVRTAGQTLTPALMVEGLRVFHLWEPEPAQLVWVLGAAPVILAFVQNKWEKARGRKLIGVGAARTHSRRSGSPPDTKERPRPKSQ